MRGGQRESKFRRRKLFRETKRERKRERERERGEPRVGGLL